MNTANNTRSCILCAREPFLRITFCYCPVLWFCTCCSGLIHAKLSGIVMSDHDSNKTCVDSNWHWETRTSAFNLVSMDGAIVEVLPQKQMNSKVAPKGPLQMYSKVAHCFLHLLVFIHSYE